MSFSATSSRRKCSELRARSTAVDVNDEDEDEDENENENEDEKDEPVRYDMEIGAEIRFKVKSINFTRVTSTAKGIKATTKNASSSSQTDGGGKDGGRKRSVSFDINDSRTIPAAMSIIGSICEDGLGLTSWWAGEEEEEEEEEEAAEEGGGEEPAEPMEEEYNDDPAGGAVDI